MGGGSTEGGVSNQRAPPSCQRLRQCLTRLIAEAAEFEDTRQDYGEQRIIAFGYLGARLHCAVYTMRGNTVCVISLRKANRKEIALWHPKTP